MAETLLEWLARRFPAAKRQTLRRMAAAGRVRVDGSAERRVNRALNGGEVVVVVDGPGDAGDAAEDRSDAGGLRIVHEDADVLVADKPAGLLTSTVPREPRPTLLAMVRAHVARRDARARVGLIHRLDRDAAGLLVFSKGAEAYRSLKGQFYDHDVERVYAAVVRGVPAPAAGRIESNLVERADGSVHATRQTGKGQRAVTDYETSRVGQGVALLRVKLFTGRKHQIRAHLSGRGWPVVGDTMYGAEPNPRGGLLLMAVRLGFAHPRTGERATFELPLPASFTEAIDPPAGIATRPQMKRPAPRRGA